MIRIKSHRAISEVKTYNMRNARSLTRQNQTHYHVNELQLLTLGILWVVRIQWDAEILRSVVKKTPIQRPLLMERTRLLVKKML
jgi:hypothetical protein